MLIEGYGTDLKKKKISLVVAASLSSLLFFLAAHRFMLQSEIDAFTSLRKDIAFAEVLLAVKAANYEAVDDNLASIALIMDSDTGIASCIVTSGDAIVAALWVAQVMDEEKIIKNEYTLMRPQSYRDESSNMDLRKYTMRIAGVGTYESVVRFLSQIDSAPYYYEFGSLEVSSLHVARRGDVTVAMEISFFTGTEDLPSLNREEFDAFTGNPFYYPGNE